MTREIIPTIEISWEERLKEEFNASYFLQLKEFLFQEKRNGCTIYPSADNMFAAFHHTPFDAVKVVLLGQDPYHGPGQAEGLAFSVPAGVAWPPSLRNVLLEWHANTGHPLPMSGSLLPGRGRAFSCSTVA